LIRPARSFDPRSVWIRSIPDLYGFVRSADLMDSFDPTDLPARSVRSADLTDSFDPT